MIEGKKIILGGREFILPPIPFATLRKYADVFAGKATPNMCQMGDIVYAALKRNYPDLTQDDFETNCLDISNMVDAFNQAMFNSGAEAATGEAQPGNP